MHKGPLTSTSQAFVDSAPINPLQTGVKAVVEVTAYPGGHFRIDLSRIDGPRNDRRIRQVNQLTLNDADEAKDHLDALVDRLTQLVQAQLAQGQPAQGAALDPAQG
jgi:hypothetical protein